MSMCDFYLNLFFSFKEDYDQHLWSNISSAVLGGDSVVFEECEIASKSLPHGDIDIIAGLIGEEDSTDLTSAIGIVIEADNTSIPVNDTIGVSIKTHQTLATRPVSKFKQGNKQDPLFICCKFIFYRCPSCS